NLHVAVRMRTETCSRDYVIFIDDPQSTEAHVAWVIISIERERVAAVQPAGACIAAFCGGTDCNHFHIPPWPMMVGSPPETISVFLVASANRQTHSGASTGTPYHRPEQDNQSRAPGESRPGRGFLQQPAPSWHH